MTTQKEISWGERWRDEFWAKIRELGFHLGYLQKPQIEKLEEFVAVLLSQARREVMEEMAIEEIKSMELAVKEERQKVVEWAEEKQVIKEANDEIYNQWDLGYNAALVDFLTNLKNK